MNPGEVPVRPVLHAPAEQDFRDPGVSLAPEDREFEIARQSTNYGNAQLEKEERASGRWWLYGDLIASQAGVDIEWGVAALPSNRTDGDTCAWMRPASAGSYGYCYVVPTAPPASSVLAAPAAVALTAEGQAGLVKVTFWGAGFDQPQEPNVRGGQLVPFIRVGGIAMGIGYMDQPLGSVRMAFNEQLNPVSLTQPGWFLLDDTDSIRKPNTDASTLGAEITNVDVRQTILAAHGNQDHPGDEVDEFPIVGGQGEVSVALNQPTLASNGINLLYKDVWASYYLMSQRIN